MHELIGPDAPVPELDVRAIPQDSRHPTVFAAFDAVVPGASVDLLAPHDPAPVLWQLRDRAQGALDVTYIERGPRVWRVRLTRV